MGTARVRRHGYRRRERHVWRYLAALLTIALVAAIARPASAPSLRPTAAPPSPMVDSMQGRWDITVRTPEGDRPSWVELRRSGHEALVGQFVGVVGSARPVARIDVSADQLRFAIPRQWEEGTGELVVEGRLQEGRLAGTMTLPDGKRHEWTGVRAPALRREATPRWGAPIRLISRNGLAGWRAVDGENKWTVSNGVLRTPGSGANLVTERTFGDFKLHVEFRYPKGSNSGVYLRGRHEVQVQDDFGAEPESHRFGGVYGFIAPSENAAQRPDTWQTYDITLVGRKLTVIANGRTIICDREIPGITGGALDSNEGAPGPIMLQGDHGPVEYRNIVITPAR
jgi:hypothetical protein